MLFKGTESLSARQIAEISDNIGGSLNAYTAKEFTCVYARVLSCNIRTIFSVIADMTLHPALKAEELETEKGVILEERRGSEDNPDDLCAESFFESYWPDDLLGQNIVGTQETILSMTPDVLRAHMKKYYVPERMVIVFCGAFDRDEVCALCEQYFGSLQNTDNPLTYTVPRTAQFIRTVPKDLQQNVLALGFPGVSMGDERLHAHIYANIILGGSASSRLFQRIREELGLVYSVDAFHNPFLGTGVACVTMALSADKEETALRETMRLCRELPDTLTEEELERAKMQMLSGVAMSIESPGSSASSIGRSALLLNRVLTDDEVYERLQRVTLDEVRQAAREMFCSDRVSLCAVGKTKSEEYYRSILRSEV